MDITPVVEAPWWFPTETVQLAIIAGGGGVLSAVIMSVMAAWNRSREKQEDWRRQDEVAAKAVVVATTLQKSNDNTNAKLDVIHTLVNSSMTAAMQSEYDAITRELAMMREVIALNQVAGREPGMEALAAVRATEAKLGELGAVLRGRLCCPTPPTAT